METALQTASMKAPLVWVEHPMWSADGVALAKQTLVWHFPSHTESAHRDNPPTPWWHPLRQPFALSIQTIRFSFMGEFGI